MSHRILTACLGCGKSAIWDRPSNEPCFCWDCQQRHKHKVSQEVHKLDDYRKGFEDGIRCFAWWKNGVQYVGSCGTRLETALSELETLYGFNPPADICIHESTRTDQGAIICNICGITLAP